MRTKVLLGLAVALMLVVGVATIGSNMGFKISIPLTAGYANYVGLPYYNSYTDAASLLADIPNATAVKRWDNVNGAYQSWTGRGTNFTVTKGEGFIVNVNTSGNWIVVGSHDPGFAVPLTAGYANYTSVPYHTTATDAATFLAQIPNCTAVKRWDNVNGAYQSWTGRGTNFTLTPGEAYIVNVNSTGTWTPAHY